MAFGRKYFTGEGTKRWYSKEDHCTAYDVRRIKVKNEAHLLQLMGANSEDELSDGQKAMLAVYRHSLSQAIKGRHQYGYLSKVKVILSDTSGYQDAAKYPHVRRDFWPYSQGSLIQISSGHYNYSGAEDDARSTFVHEYAHSMDRTIKEFINPYGKDGSHYSNELTRPRTAFVEGINAMILYRLAGEVPNGRDKIFQTFAKTNWKVFRSLSTFTKDFAKKYPADAAKLAEIIDSESKNRLSEAELLKFVGNSDGVRQYLSEKALAAEEVEIEDSEPVARAPEASEQIDETPISAQDFTAALENAYKEMIQAQTEYVDAVKRGLEAAAIEPLQKNLAEKKSRFEQLHRMRRNRHR